MESHARRPSLTSKLLILLAVLVGLWCYALITDREFPAWGRLQNPVLFMGTVLVVIGFVFSPLPARFRSCAGKIVHSRGRYSLRTLLVLVTIAAAGFGMLGVKLRAKQQERAAVKAIRELGGDVRYDFEYFTDNRAHIFRPSANPPGPAVLRKLLGDDICANATMVSLRPQRPDMSEANLRLLADLDQLEGLYLCRGRITEEGLIHLKCLKKLKWIELVKSEATDAAADELQKALPNLKIYR